MNRSRILRITGVGLVFVLLGAAQETPIGSKWWPSPWGPDDQRGAANRMTPRKVQEATGLIKKGQVFQLGRPYEFGMPMPPGSKRHFSLTIPGSPTGADPNSPLVHHDELVSGELGQVGTQLDGLGHIGVRMKDDDYFYNGFKRSQFGTAYGLTKLGVENVGVFFTRGVLIDMAAYKGVERMSVGDAISDKDIQGAFKKEGLEIAEGDIVLIRTGHGQLWMKDNEGYSKGEPGIDISAARWLAEKKVTLVGADTWALEVNPSSDKEHPVGSCHIHLLMRNGIYILENLDLEQLAAEKVHEFAFIFAPLKLKGATGSPGNPIAVR